jgi:hypothetical protein
MVSSWGLTRSKKQHSIEVFHRPALKTMFKETGLTLYDGFQELSLTEKHPFPCVTI